ncbi:MAG TPA: hypothetical protein VGR62_01260, partial [Candidatus Binatia bacterium]|nr:hypothetical protein [Candidatus Binatia bacterium]
LLVLLVVAVIGVRVAVAEPITVQRGTRLSGTLTNKAGEVSRLSLHFTTCGVTRFGLPFCRGRFRGCGGPGCVGRGGGMTYRPTWRHGPLLRLVRDGRQCHLHVVPDPSSSVLTGTYRCIAVDSGEIDIPDVSPFDRGTFVLTLETP